MKLLSTFLLALAAWSVSGQNLRDEIAANPDKAGGVYYSYTYDNPGQTPAPKGYKPFYISHYGRHGSRWLLVDTDYSRVKTVFDAAAEADAFTDKGREVYERVKLIYDDGFDRAGDLTPLGALQHRQIAGRMYRDYPEVFKGDARIEAQSTFVVRCVLSMAAFCERLKELNPDLDITRDAGRPTTRYLNFFNKPTNPDISQQYYDFVDEGAWTEDYNGPMAEKYVRPGRLMSLLFADPEFVKTIDTKDLMQGLFYFAVDMQDTELGISLYDIFTPDELYELSVYDNYRYYVIRGPSPLNGGFTQYYAKALLKDFMTRADHAVEAGDIAADLRFGHDGNIMPFLSLLQFEGFSPAESDPEKIAEAWHVYKVSPMATNIQMIFYRRKNSGDVLVKFRHNEREVRLPIESDAAPYYHWADVRAFYGRILSDTAEPTVK